MDIRIVIAGFILFGSMECFFIYTGNYISAILNSAFTVMVTYLMWCCLYEKYTAYLFSYDIKHYSKKCIKEIKLSNKKKKKTHIINM